MPPTWHGGLASAPGTLPRQSAQQRETGGAQQEMFYFFIFIFFCLATESEKHNGSFISFFLPLGLRGLSRSRTAAMLWGTVHTSPHANPLNKGQELLLHPTRSLVGLVSNRIVFFFFYQGHYID